jgi:serine/threonine-protein kinase PknG
MLSANPWEWRAVWISGLSALASGDHEGAQTAFNTVLGQVPGELAPKLALALACEHSDARDVAEYLYAVCAATDANYVAPAAFGLARTKHERNDVTGSLEALDLVKPTSGAYVAARRRRAELLTAPGRGLADLASAAASIEGIAIDPRDRHVALVAILNAALAELERNPGQPPTKIAGVNTTEPELRVAAEKEYRSLASLTPDRELRVKLVDAANAVRPRTLV